MGKRSRISEGVEQLLQSLGDDLDTVVSSLEAHGVRARPRNPEECVLARYLNAVIGSDPAISAVHVWRYSVRVRLRYRLRRSVVVRLPVLLSEFIVVFDGLSFPQLVDAGDGRHRDVQKLPADTPGSASPSDQGS